MIALLRRTAIALQDVLDLLQNLDLRIVHALSRWHLLSVVLLASTGSAMIRGSWSITAILLRLLNALPTSYQSHTTFCHPIHPSRVRLRGSSPLPRPPNSSAPIDGVRFQRATAEVFELPKTRRSPLQPDTVPRCPPSKKPGSSPGFYFGISCGRPVSTVRAVFLSLYFQNINSRLPNRTLFRSLYSPRFLVVRQKSQSPGA